MAAAKRLAAKTNQAPNKIASTITAAAASGERDAMAAGSEDAVGAEQSQAVHGRDARRVVGGRLRVRVKRVRRWAKFQDARTRTAPRMTSCDHRLGFGRERPIMFGMGRHVQQRRPARARSRGRDRWRTEFASDSSMRTPASSAASDRQSGSLIAAVIARSSSIPSECKRRRKGARKSWEPAYSRQSSAATAAGDVEIGLRSERRSPSGGRPPDPSTQRIARICARR
jgi:hypothetical protein